MSGNRSRYYSCNKAWYVMLKFRLAMLGYLFSSKRYPLFYVKPSKGGIIATSRMQKKIKICKFTEFNGSYYFSLTVPHWPSKPFDRMVAHGGLNITAAGTSGKQQIDTVILGITRKCNYKCRHCYEQFNIGESDTVPPDTWKRIISDLQGRGVNIITFSGGEPLMRYESLLYLLRTADHSLSDFHLHTSGYGVTPETARELKKAGLHAAGIGLDDVNPERNDLFRGYKGAYENAVNAVKYFREAGIFTYINFCPSKVLISSGDLPLYFELLKDLNVGYIRLLEPKPCGGYSGEKAEDLFGHGDRQALLEFYIRLNTTAGYRNYPPVAYEAFSEAPGNMGCTMAGHSLLYIDSMGNVEPCVFFPVTFGNILNEDLSVILKRMKSILPGPFHTECPAVMLSREIRNRKESGYPIPVPHTGLKEELEALNDRETDSFF